MRSILHRGGGPRRRGLGVLAALVVCAVAMAVALVAPKAEVAAAETAGATANICVRVTASAGAPSETYRFQAEALDGGNPATPKVLELKAGETKHFEVTSPTGQPGEYQYRVSQIPGNADYVIYDQTTYTVTVRFQWKNGIAGGELESKTFIWNETGDGKAPGCCEFHNRYNPPTPPVTTPATTTPATTTPATTTPATTTPATTTEPPSTTDGVPPTTSEEPGTVTVTLDPGRKFMEGRDLTAGEFTFQLKDEAGNVLQSKTNDVDARDHRFGSFRFDGLKYNQPGTYKYTISEVIGSEQDVVYDDSIYDVTVTVRDVASQDVSVSVTKGGVEIGSNGTDSFVAFHNKIEEGSTPGTTWKPTGKLPKTGDSFNPAALVVTAAAGIVLVAAGIGFARRSKRNEA